MITVYEDSKPVRADELEPGDMVWDMFSGKHGNWCEVETVRAILEDDYTWVKQKNRRREALYPNFFTFSVATGALRKFANHREWIRELRDADCTG